MFEDEEEIHFEIKRGEVVSLDIVGTRLPWEFSIADKKSALLLLSAGHRKRKVCGSQTFL